MKLVIRVTRIRKTKDTKKSTKTKQIYQTSTEIAYYLSSTCIHSVQRLHEIIRNHWGIENSNHHVRDVTLEEDKSRIRKNPGAMAILRSFALNILRTKDKNTNIKRKIENNGWNLNTKRKLKEYEWLWRMG
jgi:predicted transposase YbfD/YdcC